MGMKTKKIGSSRSYQLPGLRRERKARTLSQEELATLSGVSRPTIARIELGTTGAYISTVNKLARGLKVPKGRLMV
jgi:transcriptional regulator with XRE-family HTH domain